MSHPPILASREYEPQQAFKRPGNPHHDNFLHIVALLTAIPVLRFFAKYLKNYEMTEKKWLEFFNRSELGLIRVGI